MACGSREKTDEEGKARASIRHLMRLTDSEREEVRTRKNRGKQAREKAQSDKRTSETQTHECKKTWETAPDDELLLRQLTGDNGRRQRARVRG